MDALTADALLALPPDVAGRAAAEAVKAAAAATARCPRDVRDAAMMPVVLALLVSCDQRPIEEVALAILSFGAVADADVFFCLIATATAHKVRFSSLLNQIKRRQAQMSQEEKNAEVTKVTKVNRD